MKSNTNKIMTFIFITLSIIGCKYHTQDLSKKNKLNQVNGQNDSVSFFIKKIKFTDIESWKKGFWMSTSPGMTIYLSIKNNTDESLCFNANSSTSCFVGLINNDTIDFIRDYVNSNFIVLARDSCVIELFAFHPLYTLFDYEYANGKDCTNDMLEILQDIRFFYISKSETVGCNQAIILKNKYPLGISNKTIITSISRIR